MIIVIMIVLVIIIITISSTEEYNTISVDNESLESLATSASEDLKSNQEVLVNLKEVRTCVPALPSFVFFRF